MRATRAMTLRSAIGAIALIGSFAASPATLTVGPGAPIRTIAQAARIAGDGDVVEIRGGSYDGDVAVWTQKRLTIRGVAGTPVLNASGRSAEGKAIWVIRDGDFVVENIAFEGARVDGGNGAGIRFERGRLTVRRCVFTDNENGLLTANFPDSELTIEDSRFSNAPRTDGSLKHLLYVGRIARFTLVGSRFHRGFRGHLVKSRARDNHVAYNLLYDGPDGRASYELEFPNGGIAHVIGNVIGQSAETENPVVVSYGAEGPAWERNELYVVNNTLISDNVAGAWFLRVASDLLPADTKVVGINNLTVGVGVFTMGAHGRFAGNFPALSWALADPQTLDFRLRSNALVRGLAVVPVVDGHSLAPTAEFALPVGTTPLPPPQAWTPGAFQSTSPLH
jgi:hypothetical protein